MQRTAGRAETASGFDAWLALPSFGVEITLAALYEGTPLRPRGGG